MTSLRPRRRVALAAILAVASSGALAQNWKPTQPIKIIVPWAAGGSTDQVTRVTAAEIEKALGQKVVIVNQPGASGSIGTKNALDAPKDGYTWTAGAAQDLGTYRRSACSTRRSTTGCCSSTSPTPGDRRQSEHAVPDRQELIDAMKAKPGAIRVATAGVTSAGHNAMELIAKATGVNYRTSPTTAATRRSSPPSPARPR